MSFTRQNDLQDLRKDYQNAKSDKERQMISDVAHRISKESRKIDSMRQSLIEERRKGNTENVRDINEWVAHHPSYQNER